MLLLTLIFTCPADGRWKRSVNVTNPLGTKGNLASAYSSLVSALWNQEYHFIQPLSFRVSRDFDIDSQKSGLTVLNSCFEQKSIVKFAPAFVSLLAASLILRAAADEGSFLLTLR